MRSHFYTVARGDVILKEKVFSSIKCGPSEKFLHFERFLYPVSSATSEGEEL